MRNDELAFELNRLKHEYRNLQKHFNALMLKAIILKVETRDFGTQTLSDDTYKNSRVIVNQESPQTMPIILRKKAINLASPSQRIRN